METLTPVAHATENPHPPLAPRRRRRPHRPSARTVVTIVISAALFYLVLVPIAILIFSSFRSSSIYLPFEPQASWTLSNYSKVFGSAATYHTLGNTAVFALGSLILSFAISVALAIIIERTDIPFRKIIYVGVIAQIGIPTLTSALGWDLLLAPRTGYINVALRGLFGITSGSGPINVFTMAGMIFVQAITLVPMTFLLLSAAFRAMDVSLEEAALISGATSRVTMLRITLPVLLPALLSAAVYMLVAVIETLDVPLVIGVQAHEPVLSLVIYEEVQAQGGALPNYGLAATYSMLIMLIVIGPLYYYNRIISRAAQYSTVTGKGYRPKRYALGRFKPLVTAGVGLYLLIGAVLPIAALLWTSFLPFPFAITRSAFGKLTFHNYRVIVHSPNVRSATEHTLVVGVAAALGAMVLGLLVAWVIVRGRQRTWSRTIDGVSFLPHAAPGVIVALAVLLIYLYIPNPIYDTVWIIALAIVTQKISLSSRLMSGSLAQIDVKLEEAALVSGARWRQVLARVVVPLTSRPFLNGALLVFLLAIKDLTVPLVLNGPNSNVLSTVIWQTYGNGSVSLSAAEGTILVVIGLIAIVLVQRFGDLTGIRE